MDEFAPLLERDAIASQTLGDRLHDDFCRLSRLHFDERGRRWRFDAAELALAQASALADELSDVDPNSEFGQALGRTRQLFRVLVV